MDPITTAIWAAITAGVVAGVGKVAEQAVVDAYNGLKDLLKKKLGARSKALKAVKELEASPKSEARKAVLQEEIAAAKADKDTELVKAAQALLKSVKALPGGEQIAQTAIGDGNIQVAGSGNAINVNTQKAKR